MAFREIDALFWHAFVWSVHFCKLVCDRVCLEKIPFLGWPAERAVSIQWKCRLGHWQRCSPAHSALPVAVTVTMESFWQHCRGDLYLARLWLKAEVLPWTAWACDGSASPSYTPGLCGSIVTPRASLGDPLSRSPKYIWSQFLPKQACSTLGCQINWFAISLYLDTWGCCNLTWAIQEAKGQWDAFVWIKFQDESLGQGILTCVASSPHTLIVQPEPHACSEAPLLSKLLL